MKIIPNKTIQQGKKDGKEKIKLTHPAGVEVDYKPDAEAQDLVNRGLAVDPKAVAVEKAAIEAGQGDGDGAGDDEPPAE